MWVSSDLIWQAVPKFRSGYPSTLECQGNKSMDHQNDKKNRKYHFHQDSQLIET